MKIQAKGTNKYQIISPKEWAEMERLGTDSEYDIIERNTIWAEQIDNDGNPTGLKQEYEKEHWENMLAHPKRLLWRSIGATTMFQSSFKIRFIHFIKRYVANHITPFKTIITIIAWTAGSVITAIIGYYTLKYFGLN